jgi:hypothetical protein
MLVINQPTYLPWAGYFDLIDQSSVFVFLDDVQFDRQSWQQRNRIISTKGYLMISVPVKNKGKKSQLINEVEFSDSKFKNKHLLSIKNCYSKSKYFKIYFDQLENIFLEAEKNRYLADLNIILIKWISKSMGIETVFKRSSELNIDGKKGEKVANICLALNEKEYLTSIGAVEYLKKQKIYFDSKSIKIFIQKKIQFKYKQQSQIFLDQASALDLLFNEGPNSITVIRSNRKEAELLSTFD